MKGKLSSQKIENDIREFRYSKGDRKGYLIDSSLLVDAGCPLTEEQLESVEIEYLVLTHCHFDHIVYANRIQNLTECKLACSEPCAQHLKQMDEVVLKEQFQHKLGQEYSLIEPLDVDIVLADDDELGPLQVLAAPGHSDGGLAFYHPQQKALFSGDTLFGQNRGRADLPSSDSSALDKSVRKLKQLDYRLLCPGHGPTRHY